MEKTGCCLTLQKSLFFREAHQISTAQDRRPQFVAIFFVFYQILLPNIKDKHFFLYSSLLPISKTPSIPIFFIILYPRCTTADVQQQKTSSTTVSQRVEEQDTPIPLLALLRLLSFRRLLLLLCLGVQLSNIEGVDHVVG